MFNRTSSDIRFLAVTFILVVLLGARTFASLTEPEETHISEASLTASTQISARGPASIPSVGVAPKKIESTLHQSADFDLNCNRRSALKLAVKGPYVQLRGKSCVRGFQAGNVEIVNKSNGFTASVFDRGSDKYQTDLIQLQKGENEIVVRYKEASGKTAEEIIHVTAPQI